MFNDLNGLLSGKYDSTKQRAVLLNGDRLRNYRSYTATMRMELLLTGHLIFTDAQFFDGLYFHWLGKDINEIQAFRDMLVSFADTSRDNVPVFSISVKCRNPNSDEREHGYQAAPDLGEVAVKTFCKEFQFSSIEDDKLVTSVFDLSSDYSEQYLDTFNSEEWSKVQRAIQLAKTAIQSAEKTQELEDAAKTLENVIGKKIGSLRFSLAGNTKAVRPVDGKNGAVAVKDIDTYIADMESLLKSRYGEHHNVVKSWERYSDELKELFNLLEDERGGYADKWGFCWDFGQWDIPDWADLYRKCWGQALPNAPDETYLKRMEELLAEAEGSKGMDNNPAASRYFARIRDELNRGVTNRSKITIALDALGHLNNETAATDRHSGQQYANDCFRDFRQLLNDRYNKVLACQHGCKFLDLCDYTKVFTLIQKMGISSIEFELPTKLVIQLAELSWADFRDLLNVNRAELENAFNRWITEYDNFSWLGGEYLRDDLNDYLAELTSVFADASSGKSAAPTTPGPWNIENTCQDNIRDIFSKTYPFPYYLVGGGSFEPGTGETETTDGDAGQTEGNEICILCVEKRGATGRNGMAVLRLRLKASDRKGEDASEDYDLNTLLAPVGNPLNGGSL